MQPLVRSLLALPLLGLLALPAAAQPPPTQPPVAATVETTLKTAGKQIRMYAFDGDPNTYFASATPPTAADHFTLVFDKPVALKAVTVRTGKPGGGDQLDAGTLEISADGKTFAPLAQFAGGTASAKPAGKAVKALRLRPAADLKHPLVVREIALESTPAVTVFKYPVEFVVDVRNAPDLKEWAEKVARLCERWYPLINEELKSEGYKPPTVVTMALKSNYKGVAAAGGGRITGSVSYFKKRPGDVGAMIHETVHIVQQYRTRGNPGWLVEGIADYIRFFKYEPGKIGKINPATAKYNGSYRVSAAFLAYLTEKYDRDIVRKLNKMMREGEYNEAVFKKLTKKTLPELGKEWQQSLRARRMRRRGLTAPPSWGTWPGSPEPWRIDTAWESRALVVGGLEPPQRRRQHHPQRLARVDAKRFAAKVSAPPMPDAVPQRFAACSASGWMALHGSRWRSLTEQGGQGGQGGQLFHTSRVGALAPWRWHGATKNGGSCHSKNAKDAKNANFFTRRDLGTPGDSIDRFRLHG